MVEVEEVTNKMQSHMRLCAAATAEDEDANLPFPALFDKASRLHSLASSSSLDQEEGIRKGVELLRRCDDMVTKLALFSSNETKDDVSTANLKYLLVPYYLREMTEQIAQEDRVPIVKASQDHLKVQDLQAELENEKQEKTELRQQIDAHQQELDHLKMQAREYETSKVKQSEEIESLKKASQDTHALLCQLLSFNQNQLNPGP